VKNSKKKVSRKRNSKNKITEIPTLTGKENYAVCNNMD
jgi:hypothetical protein